MSSFYANVVIFERENRFVERDSNGEPYELSEALSVFIKSDRSGYGFIYKDNTGYEPTFMQDYFEDIEWDKFCRMKLTTEMRDILGSWKPEE